METERLFSCRLLKTVYQHSENQFAEIRELFTPARLYFTAQACSFAALRKHTHSTRHTRVLFITSIRNKC